MVKYPRPPKYIRLINVIIVIPKTSYLEEMNSSNAIPQFVELVKNDKVSSDAKANLLRIFLKIMDDSRCIELLLKQSIITVLSGS